ncbi:putative peptide maturation dehydrogenase [Tahibacter harae]|uniref:Peptide maturation dehydrogenase n=1 Tax=Tahibacter harae TaxID=2963937 RepID=A0ABT1QTK7_9GAMM|nr:putative peptide maturation dehydrogenase [Tahibacter harae]
MRVRRCAVLVFEPRESLRLDLEGLLAGGDGIAAERGLYALAAHLDEEIPITPQQVGILAGMPVEAWSSLAELHERYGASLVDGLLERGLLLSDQEPPTAAARRDQRLRDTHWAALSATQHYFSRWSQVRSGEDAQRAGYDRFSEMVDKLGAPPAVTARKSAHAIALPPPLRNSFDELLQRRATCRNFDASAEMDGNTFSTLLHRVFGAQAVVEVLPGNPVLKRNSPSGGGLHPTEAYLIVKRVAGVACGLYHYQPLRHELELLQPLDAAAADDLALRSVAAQRYFADAPVLIALVSRFARSFWKYRNHAKAYRVVTLDAGHLSQTLYLAATEQGLGAFVTAAINEKEIEQAFGLDGLDEGVLAVCGFGRRAAERVTSEFDPLGKIWPDKE